MSPRPVTLLRKLHGPGPRRGGFTLIELMVVVGIMSIVMAIGVPSIFRAMRKEGLRKAEADLVEACSHARAQAILSDVPMEVVIRAEGGHISVQPVQKVAGEGAPGIGPAEGDERDPARPAPKNFTARLDDDIAVKFLYVNFKDQMQMPEARIRFFPNGTCDEFTTILMSTEGERKISVDVVTGLADVEILR